MKNLIAFLSLWISLVLHAQQPQWLNPKPFGGQMYDIEFFDTTRGLMAGAFGSLALTMDEGQTWELTGPVTTSHLYDIEMCNPQTAIIMADTFLLRTDDGGQLFTPIGSLDSGWYYAAISMVNENLGYAACKNRPYNGPPQLSKFGVTHNGGVSWQWTDYPPLNVRQTYCLAFADSLHGVAVIRNSIDYVYTIQTSDGGQSWNETFMLKASDGSLNGVRLACASNGNFYIASCIYTEQTYFDNIRKSTDYGLTWNSLTYNSSSWVKGFSELKTYGDSIVVAMDYYMGNTGTLAKNIFISLDAGSSWNTATKPDTLAVNAPSAFGFRTSENAFLWVANGDHHQLAVTYNLSHFQPVDYYFSANILDMIVKDDVQYLLSGNSDDGYLVNNSILKSVDGGNHWTTLPKPTVTGTGAYYYWLDMAFSDAQTGFVVVDHDSCLFRTFDGGLTWQIAQPEVNPRPGAICTFGFGSSWYFNYEEPYYPTILPHQLFHSTNMGTTWEVKALPDDTLVHMQFLAPDTGFLFGGGRTTPNGGYYLTRDGAQSWEFHDLGIKGPLTGKMLNSHEGFVKSASRSHKLYYVNNDAIELIFQADSLSMHDGITDFDFSDANHGYVVTILEPNTLSSDWSWLHYTANGGLTWETYGPYEQLNGVKTFYDANGFAYGAFGQLLQLGNGYPVGKQVQPSIGATPAAWPNPTSGALQITLPHFAYNGAELTITSVAGDVISREMVSGESAIVQTRNLPAGLYLYTLANAANKTSGRFVVR